ncbi:hypothetical protein HMPREF1576_00966 [Gardnerella pickettii JCP7719]|uniref:Uncharacterized protein n=1 Tax=Gardnerella pickettii JCP7719 TaxID=1261061 RepID=S4I7G1_9BIFI|nr:hypothetical protein HMPREF1576_00966 [Gardnerella pickettii JCP7719]
MLLIAFSSIMRFTKQKIAHFTRRFLRYNEYAWPQPQMSNDQAVPVR